MSNFSCVRALVVRSWRYMTPVALTVSDAMISALIVGGALMFTSGQISEMLEIPPSTLRRYVKDYGAHLSPTATKKRGRRFDERDVSIIARGRELLQQGRSPEEVAQLLGVLGDGPPEKPSDALALVPSISKALTEAIDAAQSLRVDVDTLSDHQADQDDRISNLEAWMNQPWYRRLIGPPK